MFAILELLQTSLGVITAGSFGFFVYVVQTH
jgi:hypothetical protein